MNHPCGVNNIKFEGAVKSLDFKTNEKGEPVMAVELVDGRKREYTNPSVIGYDDGAKDSDKVSSQKLSYTKVTERRI
jgi:hypothetical protein